MSISLLGSYRKLLGNSVSAISAAIEIYNKPQFEYRDETFVILLVNAWELALKAILSKNRKRIYYPKKRNVSYRTYSISDALEKTRDLFPKSIDFNATKANLELLIKYRDNTVHYYNEPGMSVFVYSLAQTSIVNYCDLLKEVFGYDLSKRITLALVPLALAAPIDPIEFMNQQTGNAPSSKEVREFCNALKQMVIDLETGGSDTGRLLTHFKVNLQSTKKIESSDFVIGVDGKATGSPVLVNRRIDPNKTHPFRRKDIITSIKHPDTEPGMGLTVGGHPLTAHVFTKIVQFYKLKDNPRYFWSDSNGYVAKYSNEFVEYLKRLTKEEVDAALNS